MMEYVTLESAMAALDWMDDETGALAKRRERAEALLVKRKFNSVGRAQNLSGTAGAFTQAVFDGKDVKENDWLYVEEK